MSYWVSLCINTGKENKEVVDIGNMTSNIAPMYYDAFGKDWKFINNQKCKDIIGFIEEAYLKMENNPDKYKAMNPSNGWGNYEGALEYLKSILKECEENPNCIISISY